MIYNVICVLIMALVTYIPRAIPLAFIKKKIKSEYLKSFLYYVPYAVLAALTFPSIFYFSGNFYLSLIGTIVALGLSFMNLKMYVVAFVSVAVVFGCSYIFY